MAGMSFRLPAIWHNLLTMPPSLAQRASIAQVASSYGIIDTIAVIRPMARRRPNTPPRAIVSYLFNFCNNRQKDVQIRAANRRQRMTYGTYPAWSCRACVSAANRSPLRSASTGAATRSIFWIPTTSHWSCYSRLRPGRVDFFLTACRNCATLCPVGVAMNLHFFAHLADTLLPRSPRRNQPDSQSG